MVFARTGRKPKAMYPKAGHGLKVIFETEELAADFYASGSFFATMRVKVPPWTVPAEIRVLEWTVGEDAAGSAVTTSGTSTPHSESSRDAGTGTMFTARDMHLAFLDIDESIGTLMRRIDVLRIRMDGATLHVPPRAGESPYGIGVDMNYLSDKLSPPGLEVRGDFAMGGLDTPSTAAPSPLTGGASAAGAKESPAAGLASPSPVVQKRVPRALRR